MSMQGHWMVVVVIEPRMGGGEVCRWVQVWDISRY
jgi:hypothetical protein